MPGNTQLWQGLTEGPLTEPSHIPAVFVTGVEVQIIGDKAIISAFQSLPCGGGMERQVVSKWVMALADYETLKRVCAQTNGLHLAFQ